MCLCYGNPIYGSNLHLGAGVAAVAHNEEALAAWLKYVEATVDRYKDTVTRWEIWNEPNGHGCEEYATLLMKTAETIEKVQPDAVIMGLSHRTTARTAFAPLATLPRGTTIAAMRKSTCAVFCSTRRHTIETRSRPIRSPAV